ncbi:hypothetical protein ACFWC2_12835 [Streptomyces diastaticus]
MASTPDAGLRAEPVRAALTGDGLEHDWMPGETYPACDLWPPEAPGTAGDRPAGRQPAERPPLIAWAVTTAGDLVCRLPEEDDPDQWPFAVRGRHVGPEHRVIVPHGTSGFLLGLFHAEPDKGPLSDSGLRDEPGPRFISETAKERRRAEGIHPWTGEPGPLAGISFDDFVRRLRGTLLVASTECEGPASAAAHRWGRALARVAEVTPPGTAPPSPPWRPARR